MPENWDAGFRQARGDYLLLVSDKQLLRPDGLASIQEVVARDPVDIINWRVDRFDERPGKGYFDRFWDPGETDVIVRQSKEILRNFLSQHHRESSIYIPKLANSCCSRALYDEIVTGPAGRFCLPVDPDWTAAFLQLALRDEVTHIGRSLSVVRQQRSNAMAVLTGLDKQGIYMGSVGTGYELTPVKSRSHYNFLINDFLMIKNLIGGNLAEHDIDLAAYYIHFFQDICEFTRKFAADLTEQEQAWREALSGESSSLQARVHAALVSERAELRKTRFVHLVGRARRALLGDKLLSPHAWRSRVQRKKAPNRATYPDVMTAVWRTTPQSDSKRVA